MPPRRLSTPCTPSWIDGPPARMPHPARAPSASTQRSAGRLLRDCVRAGLRYIKLRLDLHAAHARAGSRARPCAPRPTPHGSLTLLACASRGAGEQLWDVDGLRLGHRRHLGMGAESDGSDPRALPGASPICTPGTQCARAYTHPCASGGTCSIQCVCGTRGGGVDSPAVRARAAPRPQLLLKLVFPSVPEDSQERQRLKSDIDLEPP